MREIKLELAGRLSQNKPLAAFLASDPWRCLPCAPRSLAPADRGDHSTQPMSSPAARNCIRAAPPAQKMGAPGTSPQRSEGRAPGRPQTHQREKRTGTRNGCPILAQCRGPQGQVFVLGVVEQGWEPHPSPSQRHPKRPAIAFGQHPQHRKWVPQVHLRSEAKEGHLGDHKHISRKNVPPRKWMPHPCAARVGTTFLSHLMPSRATGHDRATRVGRGERRICRGSSGN